MISSCPNHLGLIYMCKFWVVLLVFGVNEAWHFKSVYKLTMTITNLHMVDYSQTKCVWFISKVSDNIFETMQNIYIVTTKHLLEIICCLSNCSNNNDVPYPGRCSTYYLRLCFTYQSEKRKWPIILTVMSKPKDFSKLKVTPPTVSCVRCKSGNISETVHTASLFKCDFFTRA